MTTQTQTNANHCHHMVGWELAQSRRIASQWRIAEALKATDRAKAYVRMARAA